MANKYDCIVLFSGGLDSLLTAKLLQEQGFSPLCLHFYSPFFGKPDKITHWQEVYNLDIRGVDASLEFTRMLINSPAHGTGKTLNPCIDCKIELLKLAKALMPESGARFIATGEVIGQRPMSQRSDSMRIIARESGCKDILLRPLCARHLPANDASAALPDIDRLPSISGRGRNVQLDLAHKMGISEIPSPAGGCRLTEIENGRRYWVLLQRFKKGLGSRTAASLVDEFRLANHGRLYGNRSSDFAYLLSIGRNKQDNEKIRNAKREGDIILRLPFPGPLGLCWQGEAWPEEKLREAAAILASCSTRAGADAVEVGLESRTGVSLRARANRFEGAWDLPEWAMIREELRTLRRLKQGERA